MIEINFENLFINKDDCYIHEKDKKHKLIFDLPINKYPFIKFIPDTSPFLCYLDNTTYYLETIISDSMYIDKDFKPYKIIFDPLKRKINNNFIIYKLKIASSLLFPNTMSINKELYDMLFNIYNGTKINLNHANLNEKFRLELQYDSIITILIEDIFEKFIGIEKKKIELFKSSILTILKSDETYDYEEALNNFLSEYRLCSETGISCSNLKFNFCDIFLKALNIHLERAMSSITIYENISDFIMKNFDKWIHIMELNILINILSSSYDTCWDVQNILNTLNNILNFNDKLKTGYFYYFELLFLLQNDYIFSKKQLDKYKIILSELNPDGIATTQLKLHQFMMGKGKTSVFTPLLAFAVKLLKNKNPTIITSSHLVKDTKQIMLLTEYLLTTKKKIMEFTKKPMETSTQGNGKTIKLMVKENLFGKMEIHMKDHGFKTKEMGGSNNKRLR